MRERLQIRHGDAHEGAQISIMVEHGDYGGWGGIRTHGTVSRTPVFKTGSLNHSDTHPSRALCAKPQQFASVIGSFQPTLFQRFALLELTMPQGFLAQKACKLKKVVKFPTLAIL